MSIVNFLCDLANCVPNAVEINNLISSQSHHVKKAFQENNATLLKELISNQFFYANETKVTNY